MRRGSRSRACQQQCCRNNFRHLDRHSSPLQPVMLERSDSISLLIKRRSRCLICASGILSMAPLSASRISRRATPSHRWSSGGKLARVDGPAVWQKAGSIIEMTFPVLASTPDRILFKIGSWLGRLSHTPTVGYFRCSFSGFAQGQNRCPKRTHSDESIGKRCVELKSVRWYASLDACNRQILV
jgi:hypothetical protein